MWCMERWLYAGRVKTLHPGVHGGILARRDLQEHLDAVQQHSISLIDVVSVCMCLMALSALA